MTEKRLYLREVAVVTGLKFASLEQMRSRGQLPQADGFDILRRTPAGELRRVIGKPKPWWFESTIVQWRADRVETPNPGNPKRKVSRQEIAELTGLDVDAVKRLEQAGKLPARCEATSQHAKDHPRWWLAEIQEWWRGQTA